MSLQARAHAPVGEIVQAGGTDRNSPEVGPSAAPSIGARRAVSVLSPLILLLLWETAARTQLIDTRFFPAPASIVFGTAIPMIQSGELWTHLSVSLARIAVGFFCGAVPGVVIGLAMGLNPWVRAAIQPIVDATFPIPKSAITPLFLMIFGLGENSKYAIIAVAVVYLVLINTVSGVSNIDRIYLDVGKNYHASRLMMFMDVALPGALPMIFTGLKLGMGVALLIIVIAEIVGAKSGLGFLIWNSWQIFQVEKMYVGLMVSALLGFASASIFNYLERRLIPWKSA
ncbi:MAG: ABC transporter permease [Chloroflexi bacterium]|nr:ABC transporter permease [Chloroflexota bacterium]